MKVFVATSDTQGFGGGTVMDCIEGELVWMVDPCPLSRHDPGGPCACGVTFRGMYSEGTTSTALVREITGLTRGDFETALEACHDNRPDCTCPWNTERMAETLLRRAARWPTGAIVSRHLDVLQIPRMPAAT